MKLTRREVNKLLYPNVFDDRGLSDIQTICLDLDDINKLITYAETKPIKVNFYKSGNHGVRLFNTDVKKK